MLVYFFLQVLQAGLPLPCKGHRAVAVANMEKMSNMLHMYKMYDAARKSMYVAMECESDPTSAHSAYKGALQTFEEFLNAAEKEHGMYRDLVGISTTHGPTQASETSSFHFLPHAHSLSSILA